MRTPTLVSALLWTLQVLLEAFFALASGAPKLFVPHEVLPMPIPLSSPFLYFIGVAEVLGALGLVLPSLLRIRPALTPLAGACLTLLTACATAYQLMAAQPGNAAFAVVMAVLCAFVAYGRWRLAPITARAHPVVLQPAI